MKKEHLIKTTIALAVLILAFSIPAIVSSLTVAPNHSLAKSNQTTSISEYQPICPEESYTKITELHEEGLSEDEIAEELAFSLDIVTRYLKGNYTPLPCPESKQSISPSECPTYSKIKDLYGEGWSKEKIAETLVLPLDVVNGFISGDTTIISSCPEPYQRMPLSKCPTYSKIKDLYGEGWSEEKIAETLELPLDIVNGFLSGNYTIISSCPESYQSPTYDRLLGAKENDNQNITKLRQEFETQMKEYTWADKIAHDIMIEKYDRPPRAKEYKPREGDRPTPPLPPRPDLLPYFKDSSTNIPKDSAEKYGVAAGYQVFGGDDKPVYCGRVYGHTNSIPYLKDDVMEWHVIHQWGRTSGGDGTENCVVITRNDSDATFGIVVSSLGGSHGGYQDWVHYPANHEFYIGLIPQHDNGNREYDRLYFWVWDLTANEWWSHIYTLPETELIDSVDAALEHNITVSPNGLWKNFYQFRAYDQNIGIVDLKANFGWLEHPYPHVKHEHAEDYYDTYGPNTEATLWQRKTLVGDSYEPDDSFDIYSTMDVTSSLQSQSRSIDPTGDNDYIRFYAQAGKDYIFYTEGSTDTYGYLYDSNQNQLTYDDDSGSGYNFRIEYPISSSGYYFLRVRGYSSSTTGPYTLYYKYETPGGGDLITSKSGTLSGTGNSYTFSVSGYSTVTAVMAGNENADFDLYAKWGSPPTTSNYDARGYSSTSLEYFTTSGSGTLYIMVRSYSGSGHWKCWALSGSPSANSGRKTGSLSGTGSTATYSRSGSGKGYAFNSGPDSSDFDLYTKWNSPPTTSSYDAACAKNNHECSLRNNSTTRPPLY